MKSSLRSLKPGPLLPSPFKAKSEKIQKEIKPPPPPKETLALTKEKEH